MYKIVEPSVEILSCKDGNDILKSIEVAGRVCYKSEDKITDTSATTFVSNIIKRNHLAVIEHENITFRVICDRGITHEIVRHRIASYCQESTRYVKYDNVEVIKPVQLQEHSIEFCYWNAGILAATNAYKALIEQGITPQNARSVLPTCTKTEIVVTMNLRELRHFIELRAAPSAHPDMVVVAKLLLKELHAKVPVVFDDLYVKYCN